MRTKRKEALMLVVFVNIVLVISFAFSNTSKAAGVKKMAVYDKMIKKGDVVFCCIEQETGDEDIPVTSAIVSVNCSTGEVKTLTTIYAEPYAMKIRGNYLYCLTPNEDSLADLLNKINISTGKVQKMVYGVQEYAIKGNTIYYRIAQYNNDFEFLRYRNKKMKLNGKSKMDSSVTPKFIKKSLTSENYNLVKQERGKYYYFYLHTPEGKTIFLGSCIDEF